MRVLLYVYVRGKWCLKNSKRAHHSQIKWKPEGDPDLAFGSPGLVI